jgi:electron transfer flavoprotein alpha subunit
MASEKGVLVIAEHSYGQLDEVYLELLSEGRQIADKLGEELGILLVGSEASGLTDILAHQGAAVIHLLDKSLLGDYAADTAEAYSEVILDLVRQQRPRIILCDGTVMGQDLAPRLAAKLKTGLVLDCIALELMEGGGLSVLKPMWGGKIYSTIIWHSGRPQICTVRPGVVEISRPDSSRKARLSKVESQIRSKGGRVKVLKHFKVAGESLPLTEADIIVAGGLGMGNRENWKLIEELARVLGGSVGASQAAIDAGFAPREKQIGLSGKVVAPKLYVACGISGATHHVLGIKDAKIIIAINKDRGAPIFKLADICILGDVLQVVPALISQLGTIQKSGRLHETNDALGGSSS